MSGPVQITELKPKDFASDQVDCACEDDRGRSINVLPVPAEKKTRGRSGRNTTRRR